MTKIVIALAVWLIGAGMAQAQSIEAGSVWDNQSGSVLYIDEVRENGHFHGRYVNNAPGYACQGVEYRVVGDAFAPLISFSVVWKAEEETCHTITAWTGEYDADVITTQWSLVRYAEEDGFARYSGDSVFERRTGDE